MLNLHLENSKIIVKCLYANKELLGLCVSVDIYA